MDKVLLVRGYNARSSWSFPRGKINKDESELKCAIREVFEETSYDISNGIREKQYLEIYLKEQRIRLFLIPNVPEHYPFAPRTRKEIGKIEWHFISSLPTNKDKGNYFNVVPFTK
jgi:mRNA-decapping enzyme subunit 2